MRYWTLLTIVLLFVVGLGLTVLAARSSENGYRVRVQERQQELETEARVRARLLERWVEPTWNQLLASDPGDQLMAHIGPGGSVSYDPDWPLPIAASSDEVELYERSVRGGESFEFKNKDARRAIDAYGFYLPQIKDRTLRSRLKLRIARVARGVEGALSAAIVESLLNSGGDAALSNGIPVDIAAALLLADSEQRERLLESRLWEQRRRMQTANLEQLSRSIDAEGLTTEVTERRRLERAIVADARAGVRDVGSHLLLVRELEDGSKRATLIDSPIEPGDRHALRLSVVPSTTSDSVRSVPLRIEGDIVSWVNVDDLQWDSFAAQAVSDRNLRRWVVAALALILLASAVALILAHRRQLQLAQLRAQLLTNVSHELKTPVTSMRMFAELIREDPTEDDAVARFSEIMCAESVRLSQLIDNVLDYSRHGRKDLPLAREDVNLASVLNTVSRSFAYRASEENVDFECLVAEDSTLDAVTDPRAVEQITLNLLDNALKYRAEDSPRIRLRARRSGERIQIAVEDNGIGIEPEHRKKVFDEFYRARFEDYGVQGSGLGLSISRRLAHKLGGDIELMSAPGEGSVFMLDLPIKSAENETGGEACTES